MELLDTTPVAMSKFEVRGFVRLRLPSVFSSPVPNKPIISSFGPQSDVPVKVMVTAQNRTTYFDASGAITDQTQASVPICDGKACIEIEREKPFVFPTERLSEVVELSLAEELILPGNFDQLTASMGQMLAMIDPETADLSAFNADLKKAKVPFAIERRKV